MPTTLPVPSKGALRALRNLALGTSCTVAVGAGLLTEDRRRRIHTARKVYDNAQTLKALKASRHYHGAGVLEQFEEQALRQSEDAFWLPSNVARSKSLAAPESNEQEKATRVKPVPQPSKRPSIPVPPIIRNQTISLRSPLNQWTPPTNNTATQRQSRDPLDPSTESLPKALGNTTVERQHKLALKMGLLLDGDDQPVDIEAVMSMFLGAFENQMNEANQGLIPSLVDAANKLFVATGRRFDMQEKILEIVSRHGPIDETLFQKFHPAHIMNRMIKRVRGEDQFIDKALLEDVASIYLTTFTSEPLTSTDQMHLLGEKLCAITSEAGLHDLTTKLFTRLQKTKGDRPISCVHNLIEAVHAGRKPQRNFRYFKLLYTQTSPNQLEFFKTGNLVLDTLLKKDPSKCEEFLELATIIAETNKIQLSTTWFLKTLGHDWRTNQNIDRTKAIFERMLPNISYTAHFQAVYSAMIQFCIEAGQEHVAMDYYQRLLEAHPKSLDDIRILGHFTYAKALRGDWDGVRNDLQAIHERNPARNLSEQNNYSAIFASIFKLFPASHTVNQTEEFIRMAVDKWQLRITQHISNIMIGVYSESKEIDSMVRWMDLVTSVGCPIDAGTINVLFKKFAKDWEFSFLEINRLYHQICKLDRHFGTRTTNDDTIDLLEKIAISKSRNDDDLQKNLARLNNVVSEKACSADFATQSERIYRDMVRAYMTEQFDTVLEIYNNLQDSPTSVHPKHLGVAVKSTLKSNGESFTEAAALIKKAQNDGLDVSDSVAKLMICRMEMLDERQADAQDIADTIRDDLRSLSSCNIEVPVTVLTHAMSVLVRYHRYKKAIDLWESTSSLGQSPLIPDLHALTVLLEAYIGIRFSSGVRWVMWKLTEQKVNPDSEILSVLSNERRRLRQRIRRDASHKTSNYLACIERAIEQVQEIRLALKKTKETVKYRTIQLVELAALNRTALSANLIGVRKETGAQPEEMGLASVPIGVWNSPREMEIEASSVPHGQAAAAAGG